MLGDRVDELLAEEVDLLVEVVGDRPGFESAVVVVVIEVRLLGQEIDDPFEPFFAPDRKLHGGDDLAERRLELLEHGGEVGVVAIEVVDENHAWQPVLAGKPPRLLGADLHAGGRVDHDDRAIDHPHGGDHVAAEIGIAGGVDDVDFGAAPFDGSDGEADRVVALDLVGVEVEDGVAVGDGAEPGDHLRVEEKRLGEGRLARAAVPEETDVADLIGGVVLHDGPPVRWRASAGRRSRHAGEESGVWFRAWVPVADRAMSRLPYYG